MNIWEAVKQRLAVEISRESYQNWFARTRLGSHHGDQIWVHVPSDAAKDYIEQEYGRLILRVVEELGLPLRRINYEVNDAEGHGESTQSSGPREPYPHNDDPPLNPRLTFDTFVVGSCNQFAHAAAKAVAARPARAYNPLFIYGGVGLGKTHLMHALGHALLSSHPGIRVVYTSSERFMNDMICCIRQQRMPAFRQNYRATDVLLVDDVHILGGKEATQEEFFHTFNELYEREKQIVISSDSPPKEIPGLVERLRSRFEWGLMVDLQPPDLETKMAILDKKAEAEGIQLPEDVRILIATKTRSNVRELEGALIRLAAYASLTGSPITLQMAQQALRNLLPNSDRHITIESIIRAVAAKFELQPAQLKARSNARHITYPRQIAIYLAKELTQASLPEIGRAFGGKHHTTVLHCIHKIESLRQKDPNLNRLIHSLTDSLH